jgi:hypothetical protein
MPQMKPLPILLFAGTIILILVSAKFWVEYKTSAGIDPREGMQILLSLAAGASSLFVILAKRYGPKDKHWAYATVESSRIPSADAVTSGTNVGSTIGERSISHTRS